MLVDDEAHIRVAASQALELAGLKVTALETAEQALQHIDATWPGAVISDIRMPGVDGMTFLQRARSIDADLPVILITGHGDVSMAVGAMRAGAYDFIEKPFAVDDLVDTVMRALDKRALTIENRRLREELAELRDSGVSAEPGFVLKSCPG